MADCESNYYRLQCLFPALADCDERRVGLPGREGVSMMLQVLERAPYTTLVEVSQQVDENQSLDDWLPQLRLRVRMYHDARMAEVINWSGVRRIEPRYRYPNKRMHQPDEKSQWNRFLADWLALGIGHGRVLSVPCEFVN